MVLSISSSSITHLSRIITPDDKIFLSTSYSANTCRFQRFLPGDATSVLQYCHHIVGHQIRQPLRIAITDGLHPILSHGSNSSLIETPIRAAQKIAPSVERKTISLIDAT
jgi:hypothetical protein